MRSRKRYCLPTIVGVSLAILCAPAAGVEQVATRPAGSAHSAYIERLLRVNEEGIRRALNRNDYDEAGARVMAAREVFEAARGELEPPRAAHWDTSLDALGRLVDLRRQELAESRKLEERRLAIARLRERHAETMPATVGEPRSGQQSRDPRIASPAPAIEGEPAVPLASPPSRSRDAIVQYPDADKWRTISQRRPPGAASAGERRGYERLSKQQDVVFPESTPFAEVLASLRNRMDLSIEANWNVLSLAGIDRGTPTQGMRLANVRLETVLRLLLDDVGNSAGVALGFGVVDGVVWISTLEDLNTKTWVRVYDVSDLLLQVRSFRAPTDIFSGNTMGGNGSFGGGGLQGLSTQGLGP